MNTPLPIQTSGVIMRVGTADIHVYPGRTQREVHPGRRHESMTYRIIADPRGLFLFQKDGTPWTHFRYTFQYRYLGRAFQTAFHAGHLYGVPSPIDGLAGMFRDAHTWDDYRGDVAEFASDFGLDMDTAAEQRKVFSMFDAGERIHNKLESIFETTENREAWEQAIEGWENTRISA